MDRRSLLRAILTAPTYRLVPLPSVPAILRINLDHCTTLTFSPLTGECQFRFVQDESKAVRWPGASSIKWGPPP